MNDLRAKVKTSKQHFRWWVLSLIIFGLEIVVMLAYIVLLIGVALSLNGNGSGYWRLFIAYLVLTFSLGAFWFFSLNLKTKYLKYSWMTIIIVTGMMFYSGGVYFGFPDIMYWSFLIVPPIVFTVVNIRLQSYIIE